MIDLDEARMRAHEIAARRFATRIAPECPPIEWVALHPDHDWLLWDGRFVAGMIQPASATDLRPWRILLAAAEREGDVEAVAATIAHETTHAIEAHMNGWKLTLSDHQSPLWHAAHRIMLSRLAADPAALEDLALSLSVACRFKEFAA